MLNCVKCQWRIPAGGRPRQTSWRRSRRRTTTRQNWKSPQRGGPAPQIPRPQQGFSWRGRTPPPPTPPWPPPMGSRTRWRPRTLLLSWSSKIHVVSRTIFVAVNFFANLVKLKVWCANPPIEDFRDICYTQSLLNTNVNDIFWIVFHVIHRYEILDG